MLRHAASPRVPRIAAPLRAALVAVPFLASACVSRPDASSTRALDPTRGEVPISGAEAGWEARLVLDVGDVGVWTVEPEPVFPQYAMDQLVGLDDLGRCHVMISYSGKWTHRVRGGDLDWLGAVAHGDVDPRVEGAELYVAGARGNVYQLTTFESGDLDCRLVGQIPGCEVHAMIAGDVDRRSPGAEVLVFTSPGRMYRLAATGDDGRFDLELLERLPGRVRDAVALPRAVGEPQRVVAANRAGLLQVLTIDADGASWDTIHAAPMGFGRVDLRPGGGATVLYSTLDDGRVLRHESAPDGAWTTETIFDGPQGPRGIAAGAFDDDPETETVAVFGYSAEVQLLTGRDGAWTTETIFRDRERGHWLAAGEFDGRNATDELVCSGYGGRIVLLQRPVGYGR